MAINIVDLMQRSNSAAAQAASLGYADLPSAPSLNFLKAQASVGNEAKKQTSANVAPVTQLGHATALANADKQLAELDAQMQANKAAQSTKGAK